MTRDLFDRRLRAIRRDRAARLGPELLLFDRAFDECLDRLQDVRRNFATALLIGCPSPRWRSRLEMLAGRVDVVDPGRTFAAGCGGLFADEDRFDPGVDRYDLCIAVGTLDTVNDLPLALRRIHLALKPDSPVIGAMVGGNSLPSLRASLIEGGRAIGKVVARVHPRIEPSTLASLLTAAGFQMPVVDIDRVTLRYRDLDALVRDLRAMGATSAMPGPHEPFGKREIEAVRAAFLERGSEGRTSEMMEILHFTGWRQQVRPSEN